MTAHGPSFVGANRKYKRAQDHFQALSELMPQIQSLNPDLVRMEENAQEGRRRYVIKQDPVIPDAYALILGDAVHNARSCLDHIAWELCCAGPGGRGAITRPAEISFPISVKGRDAYFGSKARSHIMALAQPGALRVIDGLEPYRAGQGELLAMLSSIDNADKHRALLVAAFHPPVVNVGEISRRMAIQHFREKSDWEEAKEIADALETSAWPSETFERANPQPLRKGSVIFDEPLESRAADQSWQLRMAVDVPEFGKLLLVERLVVQAIDLVGEVAKRCDAFARAVDR